MLLNLFVSVVLTILSPQESNAVTQMCNPNVSTSVLQFSMDMCPYGLLFAMPVKAGCLRSTSDNDMSNFYADVCKNIKYDPGVHKQIQFIPILIDGPLSDEDSCVGNLTHQCNVEIKEVNKTEISEPGDDLLLALEENANDFEIQNETALILEQTHRMFKYLIQNAIDPPKKIQEQGPDQEITFDRGEGPVKRLTEILTQSFKILGKHCNRSYVPLEFGRDIRKMFLFLTGEGMDEDAEDVSPEDYQAIMTFLNMCYEMETPFKLRGPTCKTHSKAKYIEKNGKTTFYQPDEFSYIPNKYDVVIDATFGVTSFIHGLCYGSFREMVNSNHLYQRAMERFYNDVVLFRWSRPAKIDYEDFWDHMVSANTRETLRNLDVCIQAGYLDAPFVHRIERPLLHFNGTNATEGEGSGTEEAAARRRRRRRRQAEDEGAAAETEPTDSDQEATTNVSLSETGSESSVTTQNPNDAFFSSTQNPSLSENGTASNKNSTPTAKYSLDELGLSESGWCFQTEAEQRQVLALYFEMNCPNSTAKDVIISPAPGASGATTPMYDDYGDEENTTVGLGGNSTSGSTEAGGASSDATEIPDAGSASEGGGDVTEEPTVAEEEPSPE